MMHTLSSEQRWNLITLGSAALAGVVVRAGIKAAWKAADDDRPPLHPLTEDEGWIQAVSFAVGTGVAVGLARLGARAVTDRVRTSRRAFG